MAIQAGCTERGSNIPMLKLGFAQANLLSLIRGQIQLSRHRASAQTASSALDTDCGHGERGCSQTMIHLNLM